MSMVIVGYFICCGWKMRRHNFENNQKETTTRWDEIWNRTTCVLFDNLWIAYCVYEHRIQHRTTLGRLHIQSINYLICTGNCMSHAVSLTFKKFFNFLKFSIDFLQEFGCNNVDTVRQVNEFQVFSIPFQLRQMTLLSRLFWNWMKKVFQWFSHFL